MRHSLLLTYCNVGHASSKQLDGALVADALPHAKRLRVAPRFQGMVFKSADGNGWGQCGVQWKPYSGNPQNVRTTIYVNRRSMELFSRMRLKWSRPKCFCNIKTKLCSTFMALFYTCLTVGPIQLFISFN